MRNEDVSKVFTALEKFINQKPDLDPANYGCHPEQRAYTPNAEWWENRRNLQTELRGIQREGIKARKLLKQARQYPENGDVLAEAFAHAFSGRLSWDGAQLEYTAGQYFPTEYRAAAAAVLERYISEVKPKFNPPSGRVYYSSADIERDAERAGSHFFDRDSKRFFRSRILADAFHGNGGCYFVTSEQFEDSRGNKAERRFTIRKFNPENGNVSTFGPFNVLTRAKALSLARIASEYPDAALEVLNEYKESWAR